MDIYYIYKHIRNDSGEVFYVGKGKLNRAWTKKNRNDHWHNIVNSIGYSVEIIKQDLFEGEAYKLEIEWINKYKEEGLCKANYAKGGLGGDTMSGKKRPEHGKKLSGKGNGMYGKTITDFMTIENIKIWKLNISKSLGRKEFKVYKDNKYIKNFIIVSECERETNVKRAIIRKILEGKQKTTRDGWFFQYVN